MAFIRASDVARTEGWGWGAMILPQLEQGNLYDRLGVSRYRLSDVLAGMKPDLASAQRTAIFQTRLSVYICPSDDNDGLVPAQKDFRDGVGTLAGGLGNFRPAISNYMGNWGTRTGATTQDAPDPVRDSWGIFICKGRAPGQGRVGINSITDGTSNTIIVGERESQEGRAGVWVGVRNPNAGGQRGNTQVIGQGRPLINATDPPFLWTEVDGAGEGFSSQHTGGGNSCYATAA